MVKVANMYGEVKIGDVEETGVYQRFYGRNVRRKWDGRKRNKHPKQIEVQQRFRKGINFAASLNSAEIEFLKRYVESRKMKMSWHNYAKLISMAPVIIEKRGYLASDFIQNGGFETGSLDPWIVDGLNNAPVISTDQSKSGNYSVLLGNLGQWWSSEPLGDSSLYQQVTVPSGGGVLSFWYWSHTSDSIYWDWQDAYVTDTDDSILATIFHQCDNSQTWLKQEFDMTPYAGMAVRIKFLVHQDGWGDPTAMYIDDVSLKPSTKGTILVKHPAIKQIDLYDARDSLLLSDRGLTDLAMGMIATEKLEKLDAAVSYLRVITADGTVHDFRL